MDKDLQMLKRRALTDPALMSQYIAALERALTGVSYEEEPEPHPLLDYASIASCFTSDDDILSDLGVLSPYNIDTINNDIIGIMIDVYWEDNFGDDPDQIEEIESFLSDKTKQLLVDASSRGYRQIIFWN